jgi:muramoyltetrapeptide carboxypeptidase
MMRRPPALAAGARVALVAPAGPLRGKVDLERAQQNVRSFGWEPVVAPHALARWGYLAGSDAERLADLNRALEDETIDAVWCIRGGYGAMRLLDQIDYAALRRRPKPVIGYSDITALHAAVSTRCEVVSYHGPTARAALTPFSRDSLAHALASSGEPCGPASDAQALYAGRARGRLTGGNLALLCALAGTSYAPDYDGAILVLEDVNEPVYRIDRMLTHLRLAGALTQCAGLVFGAFTDIPTGAPEESVGARTLAEVLSEAAQRARIPCIAGVPVGHIDDQWTLPLGAIAELDADARTLTVSS